MISIVFVQAETEGNVGALCRVMKNFGFTNLILVDPQTEIGEIAQVRACHAKDVLENATIVSSFDEVVKKFDLLVGTSAIQGSNYNLRRSFVRPDQLFTELNQRKGDIAIVLGRESEGLHADELEACDVIVTIPSSDIYPTLNISHAGGIICYELFKSQSDELPQLELATAIERDILQSNVDTLIEQLHYFPEKAQRVSLAFKRVISKALITKREVFALIGLFKYTNDKIKTGKGLPVPKNKTDDDLE